MSRVLEVLAAISQQAPRGAKGDGAAELLLLQQPLRGLFNSGATGEDEALEVDLEDGAPLSLLQGLMIATRCSAALAFTLVALHV